MPAKLWFLLGLTAIVTPGASLPGASVSLRRDFVHTSWTQHDGIPLSVRTIAQTKDGYLWLVNDEEGLVRFDGVRFVRQPAPCGPRGQVSVLQAGTRADGLWVICDYQLYHLNPQGEGTLVKQNIVPPTLLPVMSLHEDSKGRIWMWGKRLGYLNPDRSMGRFLPGTDRSRFAMNCFFAEDAADGSLWFGGEGQLVRIREQANGEPGEPELMFSGRVEALTELPGGGVVLVSGHAVHFLRPGIPAATVALPRQTFVTGAGKIAVADGKDVWIGTTGSGIAVIRNFNGPGTPRVDLLEFESEAMSRTIIRLVADREGSIWIGETGGLHRYRKPLAKLLRAGSGGVPAGTIISVFEDSRGNRWISASSPSPAESASREAIGTIPKRFQAVAEDLDGRIWLGNQESLGYVAGNRFVTVTTGKGEQVTRVAGIQVGPSPGELWVISQDKGLHRVDLSGPVPKVEVVLERRLGSDFRVSPRFGMWLSLEKQSGVLHRFEGQDTVYRHEGLAGAILFIQERGDSVWIGSKTGLMRWRNRTWTTWTSAQGLPGLGAVYELVSDDLGRGWFLTGGGVLAIRWEDLDRTPDGQPGSLKYLRIGRFDRVAPHQGGIIASPRACRTRDGKLLFATLDGIAEIDPAAIVEKDLVPSIRIESLMVDRRAEAPANGRTFIEPGEFQVEYTSLSLRSPENIRFRYKLEGRDPDWIEAGGQRRASYSSLAPGNYRFRVIGSGSEGVWNEAGASYDFRVDPVFWRSWWFRLMALAAVVAGVAIIHRIRVRNVSAQLQSRFEERLAERTRIAQELHDTLLQGCLSASMQLQLAADSLPDELAEKPRLFWVGEILRQVVDEGRKAVHGLRSGGTPAQDDLGTALAAVPGEVLFDDSQTSFRTIVKGTVRRLHPIVRDEVYWIGREALLNAFRHAKGSRSIELELEYTPRSLQMWVRDDGCGMDPEVVTRGREGHWGLQGMRERAEKINGDLRVRSKVKMGTEVELTVPGQVAFAQKDPASDRLHNIHYR